MEEFSVKAIGRIHSPFKSVKDMPIQPLSAEGEQGRVEIFPEYEEGLKDVEGFSHVILIYRFHKLKGVKLSVTPFMDDSPHGIFATRAPARPNAIGISTVRLLSREGNSIIIEGVDVLDGTPLIDIKPFFEKFDNRFGTNPGWLSKTQDVPPPSFRSDGRFE